MIARLREDGESLLVGTTFDEREEMMAADPETYYITDHYLKIPVGFSAAFARARRRTKGFAS